TAADGGSSRVSGSRADKEPLRLLFRLASLAAADARLWGSDAATVTREAKRRKVTSRLTRGRLDGRIGRVSDSPLCGRMSREREGRIVQALSPPTTVPEVIARMEAIIDSLSSSDGVACFTRLYLDVTEGVRRELGALGFADSSFLADLDIRFATLCFDAVERASNGAFAKVPPAWAPLFEARSRRGIAPLQFAIAGMNAHINRDLPLAVVATCRHAGVSPERGSP